MLPWTGGTQIGPYLLVSAIGAGGMGEVWKARDTRLDRIVAVKRLHGQHSARFEQEARAIAALEYVEGEPLRRPLPPAEAVRFATQVAEALEEAHGKGVIHRGLKPDNILKTRAGVKPRPTCRPSRRRASRWMRARISSRSAWCSLDWCS